jgi:flagellar basal body-associated protein FliL
LNRHDNEPQYKKYDFNSEENRRRQHKKQYSGWWLALLILVIGIALALSVSWLLTSGNGRSKSNSTNEISKTINKSEKALTGKSDKGALTSQVEKNRVNAFSNKLKDASDGGLSPKERSQFQTTINEEQNQSVRSQEQNLLNGIKSNKPAKPQKAPDQFASTHTFASVQDAKNWANATKQQWLKAGYVNYTITSNGQGYFILRFIK